MNKAEFLDALSKKLSMLSQEDIQKSIDYYSEIIDDMTEDGLSETEAVESIGTVDEIAEQILMDTPLPKLVKAKVTPKRSLKGWEIALIILGFPVWFPLIVTAISVVISVYAALWVVIVALYAVVFALFVSAGAFLPATFVSVFGGNVLRGIVFFGITLFCVGAGILLLLAFNQLTKLIIKLSKAILKGIKSWFVKKEKTNESI
ncbi:MAG: DUF1700 domain-containing protein [Oscillospiraceae bacterium]|nr:DUF1700 domain-containing protein [Oscillospiraceae bacterium]